jgi:hypothetical protein
MLICSAANCKKAVKDDDSIQCSCDRVFHIDCVPSITRTTAYLVKKTENIKFLCNECVTVMDSVHEKISSLFKLIQRQDEKFDQQRCMLELMEEEVKKISKKKEESDVQMIEQIEKVVKSSSKPTYAQKLKANMNETVLIIQPKRDQKSSETQKQIKSRIDPTEVEVNSIRNVSKGGVVLGCKTKEAVEKLQQVVVEKLGEDYESKIPDGLNPQIKIIGLSEKWSTEDVILKLRTQNAVFRDVESLKVCKIETSRARSEKVELDGKSFDQIMKMDRINIGWDRCRFFENMNVRRCFNCKGYNHKADDCKNKKACANCAEEHDTKDCKNVTERCVNCVLANKSLGLNLNVDHCAWSRECRVYKRKENDKKRKINYNME